MLQLLIFPVFPIPPHSALHGHWFYKTIYQITSLHFKSFYFITFILLFARLLRKQDLYAL